MEIANVFICRLEVVRLCYCIAFLIRHYITFVICYSLGIFRYQSAGQFDLHIVLIASL